MPEIILEAVDLEYYYPDGTNALRKVSLQVENGEKLAILGSNGAGKSTLFMQFNGIYRPNSGSIKYRGQDISYKNKALIELRKKVGIVFQDPDSQLFSASVYQDISFGPLNLGLSEENVASRVKQSLLDTETTDLEDKPTHLLSYGQKKRVSIAGVLAMEPELTLRTAEADGFLGTKTSPALSLTGIVFHLQGTHTGTSTVFLSLYYQAVQRPH